MRLSARPLLYLLAAAALTVGAATAASAAPVTVAAAHPTQASANPSGFIRVGHLAPEVGPVTVELTPSGGDRQLVINKAPYGAITDYQTLAPGGYMLAMRPTGSPEDTPPLLSADVTIDPGVAYTVLATGKPDALVTSVVNDDLTPPAAGTARVRLIQGSPRAEKLTVDAVDGPVLARNVAYGTATGYADVPQGRWTLRVTAEDGSAAMTTAPVIDLAAGSTNSLVVTDAPDGGFAVTPIVDAVGLDVAAAPAGGVETGGGGTAAEVVGLPGGLPLAVAVLGGLAALVARARRR